MSPIAAPAPLLMQEIPICGPVDVYVCQHKARLFASAVGLELRGQWEVAIAVSEAVRNVVKYAGKGRLLLRALEDPPGGVELEVADEGGGIADLEAAQRDGISGGLDLALEPSVTTRSGLGLGLGAIRRLMDVLEVTSTSAGTRVRAQRWLHRGA